MKPTAWRILASCGSAVLLLAALTQAGAGGARPVVMAGSGGTVSPSPPKAPSGPVGSFTAPADEIVQLPLIVDIDGPLTSYAVVVTAPGGAVVAAGATGKGGLVRLSVPSMPGLELDVLGTGVAGLPVQGGQTVSIMIR